MRVILDIETNGIDFDSGEYWLDQVNEILCLVIKDIDTGNTFSFYDTDGLRILGTASIEQGIKLLEQADEWIGHNVLSFDIPVLEKLYRIKRAPRIFDTLVVSRFLYPDRQGGHSLESYGERLGLSKLEAPGFTAFSPGLLTYCERDVELNHRVYGLLEGELRNGKWDVAFESEHRIADIILKQEMYGFAFDKAKAVALLERLTEEITSIDARLDKLVERRIRPRVEVKKPFNINGSLSGRVQQYCDKFLLNPSLIAGPFQFIEYDQYNYESPPQQKELALRLGWVPVDRTKAGNAKLDESVTQIGEVGTLLLRRNIVSHRRSQIQGFIDKMDSTGRLHGGANPCGTNTHRMRHKVIVNVPRAKSEFGKETRELFVASTGKTLAGFDAKQLELRMLAHYIGDKEYVERVTTTDQSRDAHVLAAQAAGSGDRDLGKGINYALIYGAGDARLGSLVGRDQNYGARIREELYRRIPGLERIIRAAKTASQRGHLVGLDGRKLYIRTMKTSALNTLIQGAGAVYMKRVAIILDELIQGRPYFKVLDMHDEAQFEIPDTEQDKDQFKSFVLKAFQRANEFYGLRCPQEPDVKFGYNWAETH